MKHPTTPEFGVSCVVVCVVLASCTAGHSPVPSHAPPQCPSSNNSVSAGKQIVRITDPCGRRLTTAAAPTAIANGTVVLVEPEDGSSGVADVVFAGFGRCELQQLQSSKPAKLVNRPSPQLLFWQFRGRTLCTSQGTFTAICGTNSVNVSVLQQGGIAQWSCTSDLDPQLSISIYRGSLTVISPGTVRTTTIGAGQMFHALAGVTGKAGFTAQDIEVFQRQEVALGIAAAAPNLSTSARPPESLKPPTILSSSGGDVLSVDLGDWNGAGSYSFQWLVGCDENGESCQVVDGAKGSTYAPDCATQGPFIVVRVTAYDQGSATPQDSVPYSLSCVG
jgi:hypothetical protein